LRRQML